MAADVRPEPRPAPPRARLDLGRLARLSAGATAAVLAYVGFWILAYRFMMLPRPIRRVAVEWGLRGLLVAYAVALVGSAVGAAWLLGGLVRRRRKGTPGLSAGRARALLLCGSTLFGLALAEVASAGWLAWEHRLPALPTTFAPGDGIGHIVVMGGSSALGHPYNPTLSVGQIVAWKLEEALPGRRFQADILAELGASLAENHVKLPGLEQRPAAVLVYSGHNEFPARFEEERCVELDEDPAHPALHALYRLSLASPLCRLTYETLSHNRIDGPPPMTSHHELIDRPMFTPSEAADVVDDFHRRLEAIVAWSERIGAQPILVIPPANESGFEPNRSLLPPGTGPAERRRVESRYREARAAEARGDDARALGLYRALVRRQPGFAEGHFRLARRLEAIGRYDEARAHDLAAMDLDGMPFRCNAPLRAAYHEVARRHPSCVLVDGPAVLRAICPHGLLDDEAMQDGHHPSLRGITALSRAVLRGLRRHHAFGLHDGPPPDFQPADVAAHFGMDAHRWEAVCNWGRSFYSWTYGFRFDPSAHKARAQRFESCARRIAAGESPQSLGFPPLSLRPLPPGPGG